jgi:hypothetical protein
VSDGDNGDCNSNNMHDVNGNKVASNEEGNSKSGKSNDNGNKEGNGDGGKSNGDGNK